MKLAILSRKSTLYSTKRLVDAALARGHEADVIDTMRCYMNITSAEPTIHYKGGVLTPYDAVIPRIGASVTFYCTAVILVETTKAARSVLEAFLGLKVNIMVQEYIKESGGADIRCFIVGGKVVAAMKRQAKSPEEFRSNLHRGGVATAVDITDEERNMAIRAAHIIGLNVAGIDIVRSNRGPLIMEVNASPGLEGIEGTTGIDVASEIIKFIEANAHKHISKLHAG